ncbi:MAG: class I SAM-dependent methyltransferase [Bacteroidia bacterium]|nr:class I SAM-dependent methyltransferase [Bacteroidia bacterium]
MSEFDIKAAEWDKNPMHWDRSAAIAKEIIAGIPLSNQFRAMEFGAGTGILSFLLKDHLKEILLLDNSSEMIRLTDEKISASGAKNLKTKFFDLEHSDLEDGKFDIIFTQMVLHHVSDINGILAKFHALLNPGGYLAIADLYPEDGSFHGPDINVHMGFDTGNLASLLQKLGFKEISSKECFTINRKISENETRPFQVFIMIGKRID